MLYPAFLKLKGLPVVVVGGGHVAAEKIGALLVAGARVTVVAPSILDSIKGRDVTLVVRPFEPRDLDGARWVVAAATKEVNRQVADAAEARSLFCNAVDDVGSATAYLGGVVRRGEVELAISTGGVAPALAGLLREALDALLPSELDAWIELAAKTRADHKRAGVPIAERRPLLLKALVEKYS